MASIKSINFNKLKIILLILLYKYDLFKYYNCKWSYNYFLDTERFYFKKYLSYQNIESCKNYSLIEEEKNNIIHFLYRDIGKKFIFLDNIIYIDEMNLGNSLIALNNLIFFCEIIKCKNIYLEKKHFWFIRKKININNNNFSLSIKEYIINKTNETLYRTNKLFATKFIFRTDIRINLIRNEIMRNLIKIKSSNKYLYIHIRGKDIFKNKPNIFYAQPPLCFYQKIINNYKFKKIYLISIDKKNPVINKLLNKYNNVIYSNNKLIYDISNLINSYNIVASMSSFLIFILQLNYNLKFLWDYDIYHMSQKIIHLHYDLYKYPHRQFTLFRMEPSYNYRKNMFVWKNNNRQKKLMLKEKCFNYFSIINKEI